MADHSQRKSIFFLFIRIAICFLALLKAVYIWGMAGTIADSYTNEEILNLVTESFWCNQGLYIAMALIASLLLWEIIKICRYSIVNYLLEKPCFLRFTRVNLIIWLVFSGIVIFLLFQGWKLMYPYDRAAKCMEIRLTLEDVEEVIEQKQTEILFITGKGYPDCDEMRQQLLDILPDVDVEIGHYDTFPDREEQPEELYGVLEKISVETVPALVFVEKGEVVNKLEGIVGEETIKEFLLLLKR